MDRINIGTGPNGEARMLTIDSTLRRELDKVTPRVTKGGWDYFALAAGIPGCLSGDTLVKTVSGDIAIKELVNENVEVTSLNLKDLKDENSVAEVFSTGKKQLYKIKTEDGRVIKATADHTFFIKRKDKIVEVKLKDLKEGDELICR